MSQNIGKHCARFCASARLCAAARRDGVAVLPSSAQHQRANFIPSVQAPGPAAGADTPQPHRLARTASGRPGRQCATEKISDLETLVHSPYHLQLKV